MVDCDLYRVIARAKSIWSPTSRPCRRHWHRDQPGRRIDAEVMVTATGLHCRRWWYRPECQRRDGRTTDHTPHLAFTRIHSDRLDRCPSSQPRCAADGYSFRLAQQDVAVTTDRVVSGSPSAAGCKRRSGHNARNPSVTGSSLPRVDGARRLVVAVPNV
jgi:hypothetical protein